MNTPIPPPEIVVGSVVKLKSGGPKMTVTRVTDDMVYTTYFMEVVGIMTASLPKEAVELSHE